MDSPGASIQPALRNNVRTLNDLDQPLAMDSALGQFPIQVVDVDHSKSGIRKMKGDCIVRPDMNTGNANIGNSQSKRGGRLYLSASVSPGAQDHT